MTRDQLEHAIRAACDVSDDAELIVFGSQAILAGWPDAPASLRMSDEVDVVPKNHPERVDVIDAMLGELSPFHATHGFYVHGVPLDAAKLPTGWARRAVRVNNANTRGATGFCVEAHDLAASKLAAQRPKDWDFVRTLLVEHMIKPRTLVQRIQDLPVDAALKTRLLTWVQATVQQLGS
jgi:hypothetical protein